MRRMTFPALLRGLAAALLAGLAAAVPFLNLLVPIVGTAAATHLLHHRADGGAGDSGPP